MAKMTDFYVLDDWWFGIDLEEESSESLVVYMARLRDALDGLRDAQARFDEVVGELARRQRNKENEWSPPASWMAMLDADPNFTDDYFGPLVGDDHTEHEDDRRLRSGRTSRRTPACPRRSHPPRDG